MITSFLIAVQAISRNRVRAGLTVLGILIGVAALVDVVALSSGLRSKLAGTTGALGANVLSVQPSPPANTKTKPKPLTVVDAGSLKSLRSVARVAPRAGLRRVPVIHGNENTKATIIGTNSELFEINALKVALGVLWSPTEEAHADKVCVIGPTLADKLFGKGTRGALGQFIRVGRFPCRVIGVLASSDSSDGSEDMGAAVLMPFGSFRKRVSPDRTGAVDDIFVSTTALPTTRAQEDVRSLLRQRHHIKRGPPDFSVVGPDELEGMQLRIAIALQALLTCLAFVSLVVGGIGVMNIMLVSVSERTREIGIRLSIGATSRDILEQFLVEAVILSAVGGVLGLVLGLLAGGGLSSFVGFRLQPTPMLGLLAVGTSGSIGVLFGFLPARRAAKLDPIQALRAD